MTSSYTIGNHFEGFMQKLVKSGRYASASEVVRDGLRLLEEREELRRENLKALKAAVKEGVESGPGLEEDLVFERLERRYAGDRVAE